jgi:hypothetical protein
MSNILPFYVRSSSTSFYFNVTDALLFFANTYGSLSDFYQNFGAKALQSCISMCRTAIFEHPRCGCGWMEITQSCASGMGLSTCPTFAEVGVIRRCPLRTYQATGRACPHHDLWGCYDRNQMRLVLGIENGVKIGTGPNKEDPGFEIRLGKCSVM